MKDLRATTKVPLVQLAWQLCLTPAVRWATVATADFTSMSKVCTRYYCTDLGLLLARAAAADNHTPQSATIKQC
jgi:hypothetical protein